MIWTIDRTPVKVFVTFALVVNGWFLAFVMTGIAAARDLGRAIGESVGNVVFRPLLLALGADPNTNFGHPGTDYVGLALNIGIFGTLLFFLAAAVLLWTGFRVYRVGALIGAVLLGLGNIWFLFFAGLDLGAKLPAGAPRTIAAVSATAAFALLVGAVLVATLRGSPKSAPAQPS